RVHSLYLSCCTHLLSALSLLFLSNTNATPVIYPLSLHDALPISFISQDNYQEMYHTDDTQLIFIPDTDVSLSSAGLQGFSNKDFLDTIPSYSAEQLSLNMIVWFLVVISGMLFGIFFYMMNVQ